MKTVLNRSRRPLKIHLSRGRVLHLNPGKEGQIAAQDSDRESVKKLVEAGDLEILGEGPHADVSGDKGKGVHPDSHGHHPAYAVKNRGDR